MGHNLSGGGGGGGGGEGGGGSRSHWVSLIIRNNNIYIDTSSVWCLEYIKIPADVELLLQTALLSHHENIPI